MTPAIMAISPPILLQPAAMQNHDHLDPMFMLSIVVLIGFVLWLVNLAVKTDIAEEFPPPIVLPLRYPEALDQIVAVLRTSHVNTDSWTVTYLNAEEGRIQARSRLKVDRSASTHQAQLVVDIKLSSVVHNQTELQYYFTISDASARGCAKELISCLRIKFDSLV